MRVQVTLHGWLKTGVNAPGGVMVLAVSDGTDVAGVIEVLRKISPLLDPRACLAMIDGAKVGPDQILKDGESVSL